MADVTEVSTFWSAVTAVVAGTPRTAASVNAGLSKLAGRTKFLYERLYTLLYGAAVTVSAADTSTDRLTVTAHGLSANNAVQFFATNGGSLPGGLNLLTAYFVDVIDADTIKVSATSGPGAAVDLTAGFAGEVYVQKIPDLFATLVMSSTTYGTGSLGALVMFLAGAQTITGAKTFAELIMGTTARVNYTSRGLERTHRNPWYEDTTDTTTAAPRTIELDSECKAAFTLPNNVTLTQVVFRIDPTDHSGTGLPGTRPKFQVWKSHNSTGATTQIGADAVDASADATAYSAIHSIVLSGLSELTDNATYSYYLLMFGEAGANKANLFLISVKWTVTVTDQDEASA